MKLDRSSSTAKGEDWGEEDFFSDDSSFYGVDDLKDSYEGRAAGYHPTEFWESHLRSIQYTAAKNRPKMDAVLPKVPSRSPKKEETPIKKEARVHPLAPAEHSDPMDIDSDPVALAPLPNKPYNPYEGDEMAKQLSEPLSDFLDRLKPSTTTSESGPWIWIANPSSVHRPTDMYIAGFKDEGNALFEQFRRRRRTLEEANPTKPPGSITRMLKADKDWLEASILSLAKSKKVTCGKWMLFPYPSKVDEVWAKVATATLEGTLGHAAKVATDDGEKPERLICIYTEDAWDKEDVQRVLTEMRRLDLVGNGDGEKSIYYKCDAYTYLGLTSGNEYNLKASMYSSRDMFKEMHAGVRAFRWK